MLRAVCKDTRTARTLPSAVAYLGMDVLSVGGAGSYGSAAPGVGSGPASPCGELTSPRTAAEQTNKTKRCEHVWTHNMQV